MKQFQLNFWNEFKKIFCYYTGFRRFYEKRVTPWKRYERLIDIPTDELKQIIDRDGIKVIILDMDGTVKHYKKGLISENKEWVNIIKRYVAVYLISNANKELTSKIAEELKLKYVYKARKPSSYGFEKICKDMNCNANKVIVIGDAIRADIIGAQRYGIRKTILLSDLNIIINDK